MRYTDKKKSNDNQKKAYNFLINKGLKPHHASAVVGNLMQESYAHLDSTIENSIGAVGIAQWLGPRRKDLENYAKDKGKSFKDFDLQLDFLHKELTTTGNSWGSKAQAAFFDTETAEEAAAAFVNKFERSGEKPGEKGFENRINNAKKVFLKFNDPNVYGKDEKGNTVSLNPETATPEELIESPKVKAEFYNKNFGIIDKKFEDEVKDIPAKQQEAKDEIVEIAKENLKSKEEFIQEALSISEESTTIKKEEPPLRENQTDPYDIDISVQGNEFFDFFIPDL